MSHSESESDSFLSADEFASDNDDDSLFKNNLHLKNNNVDSKKIETLLSVSSQEENITNTIRESKFSDDELNVEEETNATSRQEENEIEDGCDDRTYRKRPERLKNTTDKTQKPKSVDFIPNIDIAKVARTDVFTDLTHQFTSKISKGIATFQEKSSSLKGFVKENLVTDVNKFEENKFVYDDDRTKDLNVEDISTLPEKPQSNINDEILKLSNAFAKLNEKREDSIEYLQLSDVGDKTVPFYDKEIKEDTESSSIMADEPSPLLHNIIDIAPDHQETPAGWDDCNEEKLLSEIGDNADSIFTQEDKITHSLCQNVQSDETAIAEVNLDGWGDILDSNDETYEENLKLNDQPNQENSQTDKQDNLIHNEGEAEKEVVVHQQSVQEKPDLKECQEQDQDGWDDWDIGSEDGEGHEDSVHDKNGNHQHHDSVTEVSHIKKDVTTDAQDGWDDWGDDEFTDIPKENDPKQQSSLEPRQLGCQTIKPPATKPKEWSGWESFGQKKENDWNLGGWGINTLLNTATAVTSNLSAAIESGLGVPDPETMARIAVEEEKKSVDKKSMVKKESVSDITPGQFPFQHIVAGVGKIVEVAKVQELGSRVLSGGLDTLESIGKKTMEVLQEGDPGLKKKRALIAEQGQMLSKVLKEARDRAMEEDSHSKDMKIERRCHFETLFDDFQGLVHLEALEMLSRQCEIRLEQIQESLPPDGKKELQETLEEVKELCEVDEEFDHVEVDNFEEAILEVVAPLKNELSVNKIIEVHKRLSEWLVSENIGETEANQLYDEAISTMAELTAAITMQFHKSGELLILKERRKTVEEADCLMQLSSHLCYEVKSITNSLNDQLSKKISGDSNLLINLQSECDNAVGYIKQAFKLLVPLIQLGAA